MGKTTVEVTDDVADVLHDRKGRGDSYNDVIVDLLESETGRSIDDLADAPLAN